MFTLKLFAFGTLILSFLLFPIVPTARSAEPDTRQLHVVTDFQLNAAQFTPAGELLRPEDLDQWVLLGASLGLGYQEEKPNANGPGNFQIVSMERKAYQYFKANGKYADGSMFLLAIYGTEKHKTADRSGFSQKDLLNFEIHLIDKQRYTDGRAFFLYAKDGTSAKVLPPGNDCVQCHVKDAAFGGTFAQFYPAIRHRIPDEMLREKH